VVERGVHEELMARPGVYRRLYERNWRGERGRRGSRGTHLPVPQSVHVLEGER